MGMVWCGLVADLGGVAGQDMVGIMLHGWICLAMLWYAIGYMC